MGYRYGYVNFIQRECVLLYVETVQRGRKLKVKGQIDSKKHEGLACHTTSQLDLEFGQTFK